MNVSLKYHEILEENLIVELEWLKEEFEILFQFKLEKYTKLDVDTANRILDYFLENKDEYNNIMLLNLLDKVKEDIEKMDPDLF
ncbi:hypothetical protein LCGC14_1707160 [marine sediment metagenome]|uniref:Uncharacterized protein n=1 Tax=marine sediment metagenome TaxID=412755 RepID=A0A0F9HGQ6_9ZZZZ|nr:MAG: hypothetical protein Lokiarch_16340 [Candidatus Lokiarchaeum sp. GC14_75]